MASFTVDARGPSVIRSRCAPMQSDVLGLYLASTSNSDGGSSPDFMVAYSEAQMEAESECISMCVCTKYRLTVVDEDLTKVECTTERWS
jgi:hypothetical protein